MIVSSTAFPKLYNDLLLSLLTPLLPLRSICSVSTLPVLFFCISNFFWLTSRSDHWLFHSIYFFHSHFDGFPFRVQIWNYQTISKQLTDNTAAKHKSAHRGWTVGTSPRDRRPSRWVRKSNLSVIQMQHTPNCSAMKIMSCSVAFDESVCPHFLIQKRRFRNKWAVSERMRGKELQCETTHEKGERGRRGRFGCLITLSLFASASAALLSSPFA